MPPASMPASVAGWDPDELRIIRALQLSPRSGFAHLGAVLGLSEQVVARRYRKLRRDGILRVFGAVDPTALGQYLWMVRVHCRPAGTEALGAALAGRPDVAWVALTAAGSEVLFSVRSLSAQQRDALLVRALPRATQVLDIEAAVVLHSFVGLHADEDLSPADGNELRDGRLEAVRQHLPRR
jgi:DNA-binding Lrp family transcriptional regulator